MTAEQTRKAALAKSLEAQAMAKRENAKHTPGPWVAKSRDVFCGRKRVVHHANAASPEPLNMREDFLQAEANARLIAAAPELLEALVDVMFRHVPFGNKSDYANKARAAIAKATGDTQ